MSVGTAIEWTEATWNPTTGCDQVSPGCDNCYALTLAKRLKAMGNPRYQNDGRPETSGPGFGVTLHPDKLEEPLRWKKPRVVFVNSMSDLFHASVPREFIAQVFAVMALTPQHTYQILTKRPGRMRSILGPAVGFADAWADLVRVTAHRLKWGAPGHVDLRSWTWPLPNVWLGVSVEDQGHADKRIPLLIETPAAVRFLSCEPLLGPIGLKLPMVNELVRISSCDHTLNGRDFSAGIRWDGTRYCTSCGLPLTEPASRGVDWVIVGGESGPGARPMQPDWARSLRDQCVDAGVPFFFKQHGGLTPKAGGRELDGRTWDEMPDRTAVLL